VLRRILVLVIALVLVSCKDGTPNAPHDSAGSVAKEKVAADTRAKAAVAEPQKSANDPCASIQLDPAHAALFSIDKASGDEDSCSLVIQSKKPITHLALDWANYDKDGVKLGQHIDVIRGLEAGDKAKLTLQLDDGTAKIVSKVRPNPGDRRGASD
jgi:hypothetical protein